MSFFQKFKLLKLVLYALLLLGTIMTALGLELIMEVETFWNRALCWLMSLVISITLFGLWHVQQTIFIALSPAYRDKRIWLVHILTPIFAVLVSGVSSYVFVYNSTATKLHMEQGVVDAQIAQGHANTAMNRMLLFANVVESKVNTLANMAEAEKSGLFSGRGGEGEVYRRIREAEQKLKGVSDLLIQSEIKVKDLIDSTNIHIGRMRRAIPISGDPRQGLEAYTKAQRKFFTDFQALSEQNLSLQVKTMLSGFENTMVTTSDRNQQKHLARINREMLSISENLVTSMEERSLKIDLPPEWSMGSPVYLSLLYIKGGFNIAIMVIMLETAPLLLLYMLWGKYREELEEDTSDGTIDLKQLETLTKALKSILELNKDKEKETDKEEDE